MLDNAVKVVAKRAYEKGVHRFNAHRRLAKCYDIILELYPAFIFSEDELAEIAARASVKLNRGGRRK